MEPDVLQVFAQHQIALRVRNRFTKIQQHLHVVTSSGKSLVPVQTEITHALLTEMCVVDLVRMKRGLLACMVFVRKTIVRPGSFGGT